MLIDRHAANDTMCVMHQHFFSVRSNSEKNAILDHLAARVYYEDARPFTLFETPAMRVFLAEIALVAPLGPEKESAAYHRRALTGINRLELG